MVRRLTKNELQKRYTKSITKNLVCQCVKCSKYYEVKDVHPVSLKCTFCGNVCTHLGYLTEQTVSKTHIQHEAAEQEALFHWASYQYGVFPELRLMYHIPNGGSRNKQEAVNLKKQGVKAGVPDICLPVPRANFHGLYIELKAGKNKATEKQRNWLYALQKQGYVAVVCVGCEQAIEVITKYLKLGGKENE